MILFYKRYQLITILLEAVNYFDLTRIGSKDNRIPKMPRGAKEAPSWNNKTKTLREKMCIKKAEPIGSAFLLYI
jgi:hypothetical protein